MSLTARSFTRHLPTLRRLATAGAWFFVAVTLLHLAWVIWTKWADPAGTFKLYQSSDHAHDAWGLTYTGVLGLVSAMGQATVVIAAAAASVLPEKYIAWRRLGLALLCGWAALWALDFVQIARIDGRLDSLLLAFLGFVFLGCTLVRALMQWRRAASRAGTGRIGPWRAWRGT